MLPGSNSKAGKVVVVLDVGGAVVSGTVITGSSGIVVGGTAVTGAGTTGMGTTGVGTAGVGTAGVGTAGVGGDTGRGRKRSITASTVSVVRRDSSVGVKSSTSRSALSASTSS